MIAPEVMPPRAASSGSMPAEGSPARTGAGNGATLTGDGAVDGRPVREDVEEACLRSGGNARQPDGPTREAACAGRRAAR
jgi:hypothetical protein